MNCADECRVGIEIPEFSSDLTGQAVNISVIWAPFPFANAIHELIAGHESHSLSRQVAGGIHQPKVTEPRLSALTVLAC